MSSIRQRAVGVNHENRIPTPLWGKIMFRLTCQARAALREAERTTESDWTPAASLILDRRLAEVVPEVSC